ncbi:YraN family protein [Conexibacter sp. SYSU D00693]|uniref:YraN family protein n=1 Tax=Conexibacter sp. SYSU D00693 TaxID=2812560 RepID=UPI001F11A9EE|nr:YraN family protein [Conexibacter sp. SYSU D00693]
MAAVASPCSSSSPEPAGGPASSRPRREDPRRTLGRLGEELAAAHLERLGYAIVARGFRTRYGELDVVACDGHTLVFVEVKTRRGRGEPWDALHPAKRAQVRRMAREYLAHAEDRPRVPELRFDAIGVVVDGQGRLVRLDHLEAAF